MPEAPLTLAARMGWDSLREQVALMLGDDAHKKTVDAATSVVQGIAKGRSLALSVIATMVAATHDLLPKDALKRLDRIVANKHLDLRERGEAWVAHLLGARTYILIALDWTEFDADGHSTICAYLLTEHGRATPLWWRTIEQRFLKDGGRTDEEDVLLMELHSVMPKSVQVRVVADRGFADQELMKLLESWGWGYVLRLRKNITITDETGEAHPAGEWLRADGRAMRLAKAKITARATSVGSFVSVRRKGMKEAWFLVCDAGVSDSAEAIAIYAKRFTIEETFRDQQDARFGLGMDQLRVGTPEKRDRLLLLAAMSQALMTLLGAAGEACGLDKGLSKSGSKKRVLSLFRQGSTWYYLLPTLREDRRVRLMDAFEKLLQSHRTFSELLGVL